MIFKCKDTLLNSTFDLSGRRDFFLEFKVPFVYN